MKFSPSFERDWTFYFSNRPAHSSDKFSFCGEAVVWNPDVSLPELGAKECFHIFDSTGKKHPCSELNVLLGVLMFKKSLNFHIKMWAEGYGDCLQGVQDYMAELIAPPDWVSHALRCQLVKYTSSNA